MRVFSASFLKETFRGFRNIRPMELSAALSYYTLLSLAPLVLLTVSLTGLVFGREAVEGKILSEMRGLVGEQGAEVIQTVLENASDPAEGTFSLLVSILTLAAGATTVFVQLQDALNRIWQVKESPKTSAIWGFIKDRLLSLAMVVGIGFLLLVSLLISTALSALGDWSVAPGDKVPFVLQAVNTVVSLGVVTLLFAMIFKVLPDVRIAWRDVWFGALTTAGLFTLGKYLIGLYLGRASVGSAYGAAGSLIVLMVWVYYASIILFFGAQLTHTHSQREHKKPELKPVAARETAKAAG